MRIAANTPSPIRAQAPKSGLEKLKETNPYLMDDARLDTAIVDAQNYVSELGVKSQKGQTLAIAGAGVALAGMASILGSAGMHPGTAQLISTCGTMFGGVAVLSAGIWKRDGNSMDKFAANLELDSLNSVREGRQEKVEKPEGYSEKWMQAFPTQDKLWNAERNVRYLEHREDNGKQLALFGKTIALGTAMTSAGTLIANHGHEPMGALIATAVSGAGSAAAWLAGRSMEKNAFAGQAPARAQVQTLQQEYDKLMA